MELETLLLKDLARWDFGVLLIRRAGLQGMDPGRLTLEVRCYRLAILRSFFPSPLFYDRDFVLSLAFSDLDGAEAWEACQAWEDPAPGAQGFPGRFMDRLRALAPLGPAEAPLLRFAKGKDFKYGLRVRFLVDTFDKERRGPSSLD